MDYDLLLRSVFSSFIFSIVLTPIFRVVAIKTATVAIPTHDRFHQVTTPLMGGFAVFLSFSVCLALFADLEFLLSLRLLFISTFILFVSGFYDDRKKLNPFLKLPTQLFSAYALYMVGWKFKILPTEFGNMILTLVWVVGLINSMNFIDNIDGLATGTTIINSFFFFIAYICLYKSNYHFLLLPISLIGACLGFLFYNFPKAKIFLGDAGALVMGLLVAFFGLFLFQTNEIKPFIVSFLICGFLIFDTTLVIFYRSINGRKIYEGNKDHTSHRLVNLGFSKFGAVLILYAVNILLGILGISVIFLPLLIGYGIISFVLFLFGVFLVLLRKGFNYK